MVTRGGTPPGFCSTECRLQARREANRKYRGPIKRSCILCETPFVLEAREPTGRKGGAYDFFCSDTCRRRANVAKVARRNALKKGTPDAERFTLDEIYVRDEATCHLCREHCSRIDATVDHLIPLIKGGPHTRANVKLAHRSCNSRKKDRLLHELTWYQPDTET